MLNYILQEAYDKFKGNFFFQLEYGEEVWNCIVESAGVKHFVFNTRQVYPDNLMTDLAAALATYTEQSVDDVMHFFGKCFVRFFSNLG